MRKELASAETSAVRSPDQNLPRHHHLLLRALHFLLTLSFPILFMSLLGCPKGKEQKADLGPEVAIETIDTAFAKALGSPSFSSAHVGQYLTYAVLRRIQNTPTDTTIGGTSVSIMAADEDSAHAVTKYTVQVNKSQRREDGSFLTVTSEDEFFAEKSATAASANTKPAFRATAMLGAQLTARALAEQIHAKSRALLGADAVAGASSADSSAKTVIRTTFHHFNESDDQFTIPPKVQEKSDCGGLSPCSIPVHYINFDLVDWYSDTEYQKINFNMGFTAATPYIPFGDNFDRLTGILIIDCRATIIPLSSGNVYVRDCQQLDDFQK